MGGEWLWRRLRLLALIGLVAGVALLGNSSAALATSATGAADGAGIVAAPPAQGTVPRTRADLAIRKTGQVSGKRISFTLTVTNNGPSVAQDAIVVDRLPPVLDVVSIQSTKGTCEQVRPRRWVVCDLGDLAAGQVVTIRLMTTLRDENRAARLQNTAVVVSRTRDPQLRNNRATAVVYLRPVKGHHDDDGQGNS